MHRSLIRILLAGLAFGATAESVSASDVLNYSAHADATQITIEDKPPSSDAVDRLTSDVGAPVDLLGIEIVNVTSGTDGQTFTLNPLDLGTDIELITVGTGTGDDTFSITPSSSAAVVLDGGAHVNGDSLIVDALGAVAVDTGTAVQVSGYQDITYTDIETVTILNVATGTIIIEKQTDPDGALGTFDFTQTITSPFNFSISDDQTEVFTDVVPATYTITETNPAPAFDLTDITCLDGNSTGDEATGVATVSLETGETITCTFTNTERGEITIVKNIVPHNASLWDFTLAGPTPGTKTGLGDGSSHTYDDLLPGFYHLSETSQAGYAASVDCGAKGSEDDEDISFGLDPGEHITCTFTNTQQAHIVIDKVTVPNDGETGFDFELSGGPASLLQVASLTDATVPHDSGPIVPGPGYGVSETVPTGWDLTASCSDGSPIDNIHLDPGETVTCSFTNTVQTGSVQFCEDVVPNDASVWDLALSGPTPGTRDDLGDEACHTFSDLLPGFYTLSEATHDDYATAVDCGAKGKDDDGDISFSLDPAEDITCTFTNTRHAAIFIEKQLQFGRATSVLTFEVPSLVPGAYPVVEIFSTPGVSLTAITCNDGDGPTPSTWDLVRGTATFELDPGEAVTCVFRNLFPFAVGGAAAPAEPLELLAPWLGLAALISLAALNIAATRRRRD